MTGDWKGPPLVLVAEGPALLELHGDGVAHVRLNRPEASNGMNMELLKALHDGLMRCTATAACARCCSPARVSTSAPAATSTPSPRRGGAAGLLRDGDVLPADRLGAADAPGGAGGRGGPGLRRRRRRLGLVCAADLVVAGESANFLAGATRVGMAPDAGVSVTLTRLVGLRKAMEIALLNPVIDAREALELGLVTGSCPTTPLRMKRRALARQLAAGAPAALAATKRLLWNGLAPVSRPACPKRTARCRSCPAWPTRAKAWPP